MRFILGGEITQLLIQSPPSARHLLGSQRRRLRPFLVLTVTVTVTLAVGVLAAAGGAPIRLAVRTTVAGFSGPLDIPSGSRATLIVGSVLHSPAVALPAATSGDAVLSSAAAAPPGAVALLGGVLAAVSRFICSGPGSFVYRG